MASCPSCGVAIVPGYVKCPKCGNPLPALARTKSNTFGSGGGTAVNDGPSGSRLPLFVALGASIAIGIVLIVVLGGDDELKTTNTTATPAPEVTDDDDPGSPPAPQPDDPVVTPTQPANNGAEALAAAEELDRGLKRQRLWGTVRVVDERVDVRSSACEDQGMGPVIDAARPRLQGAGLTKLRCLAQSGAVVFERDL